MTAPAPRNPLLETVAYAHMRVALDEAQRRITAYKNAHDRARAQVRALRSLFVVMLLITLASLAFAVGVFTQWL